MEKARTFCILHSFMLEMSSGVEEQHVPRLCYYFTFLYAGNVRGGLNILHFYSVIMV
jgi:hypothetical protein